ncbi:GYF domain-containing protein [Anaerorhabdus sp.]|uniref:GYF domain-containing protein n=2 Tax=root TaxID=1 RepID=A0A645D855_9ZZZZ|nr:GYF domain-containing protein [Anaerorhabdus sp.]MEA4874871.1 GYF domain-containing protein [Anaerorhabdus sp.]
MDKIWYVRSSKRKGGPFTEEELIRLIRQEIVDEEYEIWNPDMEKWMRLVDSVYSFYIPVKEEQ